jgi:hypothetical protein
LLGSKTRDFGGLSGTSYLSFSTTDASGTFRITLLNGQIDVSTLGVQYNTAIPSGATNIGSYDTPSADVLADLEPLTTRWAG